MNRHEKVVYLTFDDGPIPEATPFVLDILDHTLERLDSYNRIKSMVNFR